MNDPVTTLLADITGGTGVRPAVYADDVVLDATVPGWRFTQVGPRAVSGQLGEWYADPGAFEELCRTPLPDGELVTFTLTWTENGVPHATHQVHVLEVRQGQISRQQVWCGGRWSADRLAAMAAG